METSTYILSNKELPIEVREKIKETLSGISYVGFGSTNAKITININEFHYQNLRGEKYNHQPEVKTIKPGVVCETKPKQSNPDFDLDIEIEYAEMWSKKTKSELRALYYELKQIYFPTYTEKEIFSVLEDAISHQSEHPVYSIIQMAAIIFKNEH